MNKQEKVTLQELFHNLYGYDGFKGDIPEIKDFMEKAAKHFDDHSKRLVVVETKVEERTANKMSKKTKVGYGGGTVVVVATLILAIGQTLGWF